MLEDLGGIVPFVAVAEARSFSRAAEHLGVSTAAISKAVKKLEADLGVRLLQRTSRAVSLTTEGEALLGRARDGLSLIRAGREAAAQGAREPRGTVAVSLSPILAPVIVPALAGLRRRHPGLALDLRFSDRMARFSEEGVDVAVRLGALSDSSLVARRLRSTRWVTAASPAWVARHGTVRRPEDLAAHPCARFVMPNGSSPPFVFREKDGSTVTVEPGEGLRANLGTALLDAALSGAFVTQVLDFMADDHLRAGRLVELMPERSAPGPTLHAVMPPGRAQSPRVRAVVNALLQMGVPPAR